MTQTVSKDEIARLKQWLDRLKAKEDLETGQEIAAGLTLAQLKTLLPNHGPPQTHPLMEELTQRIEQHRSKQPVPQLRPEGVRMDAWRQRLIKRLELQVGPSRAAVISHYAAAFELSSGCSVGCWFCGVSAAKLARHWQYDEANRMFWRQLLQKLQAWVGPAMAWSFCYWATDPLDNPDYERFAADFEELLGNYPSVTTALALKNPDRTRALLQHARTHTSNGVHFSLLSHKQFERVLSEFTPEELFFVDLVPQFPGSTYRMANAGRARQKKKSDWTDSNPNTIACVSGFICNLVEHTLSIVTPCPADDLYPEGYQKYLTTSLDADLDELAERYFRLHVRELPHIQWAHLLQAELSPAGLRVGGAGESRMFEHPIFVCVAELIREARHNAEQIAMLASFQGYAEEQVEAVLQSLFQQGLLEENL